MSHHRHQLIKQAFRPHGTHPVNDEPAAPVRITIIDYDASHFQEKIVENISECFPFRDTETVTWINVDDLGGPGFFRYNPPCRVLIRVREKEYFPQNIPDRKPTTWSSRLPDPAGFPLCPVTTYGVVGTWSC